MPADARFGRPRTLGERLDFTETIHAPDVATTRAPRPTHIFGVDFV